MNISHSVPRIRDWVGAKASLDVRAVKGFSYCRKQNLDLSVVHFEAGDNLQNKIIQLSV
jgi:hypothetical protein